MIRINLLGGERQVKKKAVAFDIGQRLTLACSLILVVAAGGVGYWYWSLQQRSAQVDADIVRAQQEQLRLQSIIREVNEFEQERAARCSSASRSSNSCAAGRASPCSCSTS